MSTSNDKRREQMYAAIRLGLSKYDAPDRRKVAETRVKAPPAPLVPGRAQKSAAEQKALFRGFLEGQGATVIEVKSKAEIPAAVAGYLRNTNLPMRIRTAAIPSSKASTGPRSPR